MFPLFRCNSEGKQMIILATCVVELSWQRHPVVKTDGLPHAQDVVNGALQDLYLAHALTALVFQWHCLS